MCVCVCVCVTVTKETFSEMKEHKKLIEKGRPDDVPQGYRYKTVSSEYEADQGSRNSPMPGFQHSPIIEVLCKVQHMSAYVFLSLAVYMVGATTSTAIIRYAEQTR